MEDTKHGTGSTVRGPKSAANTCLEASKNRWIISKRGAETDLLHYKLCTLMATCDHQ